MMLGSAVLPTRLVLGFKNINLSMFQHHVLPCLYVVVNVNVVLLREPCLRYVMSLTCQVAQVLLTLPYSFSQLGMLSGILFQLFYGLLGSWTAYLISILYVEYRTRKEREKVNFRNHVIQVQLTNIDTVYFNFNTSSKYILLIKF